jgi:hypothetical protein
MKIDKVGRWKHKTEVPGTGYKIKSKKSAFGGRGSKGRFDFLISKYRNLLHAAKQCCFILFY